MFTGRTKKLNNKLMKKVLLTFLCAAAALVGMAQTTVNHNEPCEVYVNGKLSGSQEIAADVTDNADGTITLLLRDFSVTLGEETISTGDIAFENLATEVDEEGIKHFSGEGTYTIPADKLPAQYKMMAIMFQNIPYTLQGKENDEKLYAVFDIDLSKLGQSIKAVIGTDTFGQRAGKVYTEQLIVTVNGESSEPQLTAVTVYENEDGTIDFELKNFCLSSDGNEIGVGTIALQNLQTTVEADGLTHFSYDGPLVIANGDREGIDMWIGPMLGEIPLKLQGKKNDEKLFVTIDIDMKPTLPQIVNVQLGTDDFAADAITGDLNGDNTVDIADAVSVLNIMAEDGFSPAADINGDGVVDIADFVSILNIMAEQ